MGEGSRDILSERGSADDGKRFYSAGRCVGTRSENRVGVWGRVRARFYRGGGRRIHFYLFFLCPFSSAFSKCRLYEICQFSFVFGSLEGPLSGAFLALLPFSCENGDPSFLHTLTTF